MDDFAQVCQLYYFKVYRFLLRLSGSDQQAEELTQEVFYKALLHIGQYRDSGHMFEDFLAHFGGIAYKTHS